MTQSLDDELIPTIGKKMRESLPHSFQDGKSESAKTSLVPNLYYSEQIARFIIYHVSGLLAQNREPSFENSLDKWNDKHADRWHIRSHELLLTLTYSITDIDLEKLQQVFLAITREGKILNKIRGGRKCM